MLFQPAIIALLLASFLCSAMLLAVAPFAVGLLRRWDLSSGSAGQVMLERRTHLVSALVGIALAGEAASLILFVVNADRMAALFTGAMCAVGTLLVNPFGFPALDLKIAVFFLASCWLILDWIDRQGWDYPLIRVKYAALLALTPVQLVASGTLLAYFLGLRADVITSCCGSLFGGAVQTLGNSLAALPHDVSYAALIAALAAVLACGGFVLGRGRGGILYAILAAAAFLIGLAAVTSTVSVYVYELPHHHCPFCLLKGEYGYVGYLLYLPLFIGAVAGLGVGIVGPAAALPSLAGPAPRSAKRLARVSMAGFFLFGAVCLWLIVRSHLVLFPA